MTFAFESFTMHRDPTQYTTLYPDGIDPFRVWLPKLDDIPALEAKRWEISRRLAEWSESEFGRLYEKIGKLPHPVVGTFPCYDHGKMIVKPRDDWFHKKPGGYWTHFGDFDKDARWQFVETWTEDQSLLDDIWYVVQRRRVIARAARLYEEALRLALHFKYLRKLCETGDTPAPKWDLLRVLVNGRMYHMKARCVSGEYGLYELDYDLFPEASVLTVEP